METKYERKRLVTHAFLLTVIAFALHYVWENVQCPLFFVHRDFDRTQSSMVVATLGDVGLTWTAQCAIAVATRRWLWVLQPWRHLIWVTMVGLALLMGTVLEAYALSANLWGYTAINPRIPGTPISVIPLFQLIILFPVTFALCRRFLSSKGVTGKDL